MTQTKFGGSIIRFLKLPHKDIKENKPRPWWPCFLRTAINYTFFIEGHPRSICFISFLYWTCSFWEDFKSFLHWHRRKIAQPLAAMIFWRIAIKLTIFIQCREPPTEHLCKIINRSCKGLLRRNTWKFYLYVAIESEFWKERNKCHKSEREA